MDLCWHVASSSGVRSACRRQTSRNIAYSALEGSEFTRWTRSPVLSEEASEQALGSTCGLCAVNSLWQLLVL